jgi:hypothetical protein
VSACLAACLLAAGPAARAQETRPLGDRVFDAIVLRPMGFLGTTVGFAAFVASLPLAGPSLQIDKAWEQFVVEPADFTFQRELGDF